MTERYCEGERFADLSFTEETFEDCDFTDCVFVDCSFTKCELDHTTLNECKFVRCEITGLRSAHSSVQSLDFEDCRLQEIEWASLLSNDAIPDPIHTLKDCSHKNNTKPKKRIRCCQIPTPARTKSNAIAAAIAYDVGLRSLFELLHSSFSFSFLLSVRISGSICRVPRLGSSIVTSGIRISCSSLA